MSATATNRPETTTGPEGCRLCAKSAGELDDPIGGYIVDDGEWLVNHAHPEAGDPGTLFLSSRRHFLDFTEMTDEEMTSLHRLVRRLFPAIKAETGASRVYFVSMMAGVPHFHVWMIPQAEDAPVKAFKLIGSERTCTLEDAGAAAQGIRRRLAS
jgi:diadenosine tetraphosphate (Ap4A) HIT family hydrolase